MPVKIGSTEYPSVMSLNDLSVALLGSSGIFENFQQMREKLEDQDSVFAKQLTEDQKALFETYSKAYDAKLGEINQSEAAKNLHVVERLRKYIRNPINISNISNEKAAVVTAEGHGLVEGSWITFSGLKNMDYLNGYALKATNVTENSFELVDAQGNAIDTENLDKFSGNGTLITTVDAIRNQIWVMRNNHDKEFSAARNRLEENTEFKVGGKVWTKKEILAGCEKHDTGWYKDTPEEKFFDDLLAKYKTFMQGAVDNALKDPTSELSLLNKRYDEGMAFRSMERMFGSGIGKLISNYSSQVSNKIQTLESQGINIETPATVVANNLDTEINDGVNLTGNIDGNTLTDIKIEAVETDKTFDYTSLKLPSNPIDTSGATGNLQSYLKAYSFAIRDSRFDPDMVDDWHGHRTDKAINAALEKFEIKDASDEPLLIKTVEDRELAVKKLTDHFKKEMESNPDFLKVMQKGTYLLAIEANKQVNADGTLVKSDEYLATRRMLDDFEFKNTSEFLDETKSKVSADFAKEQLKVPISISEEELKDPALVAKHDMNF